MNLDGTFDYSIVEVFLRALRVLRGKSLIFRKNLLTTKHTESLALASPATRYGEFVVEELD